MPRHPIRHHRAHWLRFCLLFLVTAAITIIFFSYSVAFASVEPAAELVRLQSRLEALTGYRLTKRVVETHRDADQLYFLGPEGSRPHPYARANAVVGNPDDLDSLTDASGTGSGPIEAWDVCLIVLGDDYFEGDLDGNDQRQVLAHELAHCYQFDRMGGVVNTPENWLREGTADWMGHQLVNPTRIGQRRWRDYLRSLRSLSDRSYEATVFFSHLAYQGVDVWNLFDRFYANRAAELSSLGAEDKFELLMRLAGDRDRLLETWPMGLEGDPAAGRDWDTDDPNITDEGRGSRPLSVPGTIAIAPTTQYLWDIALPPNKIVTLTVRNGYGAIRFGRDTERFSRSFTKRYCVEGTCECEGRPIGGVTYVPTSEALLAVTADFTPGEIKVQVEDVPCEEEADTEATRPPATGGDGARGSSYGDPHIVTYDGYRYSFQTVGEFVLSKSQDAHFEVQARQSQMPSSSHLSLNTAAAMKVAGHRVAIYAQDFPDGVTPLWVDGVPTGMIGRELALPGGGLVVATGDRHYSIRWPSGERVEIKGIRAGGEDFMNITPYVPREDAGTLNGLLGDFDGAVNNDLRVQGGAVVPAQDAYSLVTQLINRVIDVPISLNQVQRAFFEQLYRQFGDSWRVTPAVSLFDYGPGQSTETFTNRAFPDRFPSLAGVAPAQIREATQLCQEAEIGAVFMEGCVFDIAATGETGFLAAAVNAVADTVIQEVTDRVVDKIRGEVQDAIPIPLPRWPF